MIAISSGESLKFCQNPQNARSVDRYTFLSTVADQICKPHMLRRYNNPKISRDIRASIKRILKIEDAEPEPSTSAKLEKRGTCTICPAKKKKTNVILMQEVWKTSVPRLS